MDGFQPLTVWLPFGIDLNVCNQFSHEFVLFNVVHNAVQALKVGENGNDVLRCDFICFDGLFLSFSFNEQIFRFINFIIHPEQSFIKIGFPMTIMAIIWIKLVDFFNQFFFDRILLTKLLLKMCDFLLKC